MAEASISVSEGGTHALANDRLDAVVLVTGDGTVLYASPGAARITGRTPNELVGTNAFDRLHPDDRERVAALFHDLIQEPGRCVTTRLRYQHADGSFRWLEAAGSNLLAEPRVQAVVVSYRDVTSIQRAEEIQQFLAEASGTLLPQTGAQSAISAILDLAQRLFHADAYAIWRYERATGAWEIASQRNLSEAYPKLLRHPTGFVPDAPFLFHDVEAEPLIAERLEAYRAEGIRSLLCVPLRIHGDNSGTITIYYRRPHTFDDEEVRVATALANLAAAAITTAELSEEQQRLRAEAERASQAKDDFLAMLAHELRNPLGAISNSLHILELPNAREAARQRAMTVLRRQVRHQARMVEDLLDVSRISRGLVEIRAARLDLVRLVRDVMEDHRAAVEEARRDLVLEAPSEPVWIDDHTTRLSQVLGNLLNNAQKFTSAGGRIGIRLAVDDARRNATVTVSDNGVGIDPELLPYVFESFTQGDRSLARSRGGLGLGLALVKGLVALHGGEVRASSDGPSKGAEFTVSLPLSSEADREPMASGTPAIRGTALRILVVEDNPDASETLRDLLEAFGYAVEIAASGPAGVTAAGEFRPEVVLCDLGLPGMDGYDVAAELRRSPVTAAARLIALSGYGQQEDQRRSLEAGFDLHLTKPIDIAALHHLLEDGAGR